jgi:hypothetical protein
MVSFPFIADFKKSAFVFVELEGYLIAIAENDPQSESLSAMAKNDSIRKIGCK